MNDILNQILKMLGKKEECEHDKNYIDERYLVGNTPFVRFSCLDCGFRDEGVVMGPPDDWAKTIVVRNGVREEK